MCAAAAAVLAGRACLYRCMWSFLSWRLRSGIVLQALLSPTPHDVTRCQHCSPSQQTEQLHSRTCPSLSWQLWSQSVDCRHSAVLACRNALVLVNAGLRYQPPSGCCKPAQDTHAALAMFSEHLPQHTFPSSTKLVLHNPHGLPQHTHVHHNRASTRRCSQQPKVSEACTPTRASSPQHR